MQGAQPHQRDDDLHAAGERGDERSPARRLTKNPRGRREESSAFRHRGRLSSDVGAPLRAVSRWWALRALPPSRCVKDPPVDLRSPLVTMTARPAAELPDEQHSDGYAFEPKLDGWLN